MLRSKFLFIFLLISVHILAEDLFTSRLILIGDSLSSDSSINSWILKTNTSFIVKESNKDPVIYKIKRLSTEQSFGTFNEPKLIVNDLFGFQECWLTEISDDYWTIKSSKRITYIIPNIYFIYHRVVFFGEKYIECYWIEKKGSDLKTIYLNKIYYEKGFE